MTIEVDQRKSQTDRLTTDRKQKLESHTERVSERLSGDHRITIESFDENTGNTKRIVSESAPAGDGDYVRRALSHVQSLAPALGLAENGTGQPAEFIPDTSYQTTSSGAVAVHLQQALHGIPVFEASQTVRFAPNGSIEDIVGRSVTVPDDAIEEVHLTAEEAVEYAATHLAEGVSEQDGVDQFGEPMEAERIDLTDFVPRVVAAFQNIPEQPHVVEGHPFEEPFKLSLLWFPLDDDLHLSWSVTATLPNLAEQYLVVVDATDGGILYCRQLSHTLASRGNVFPVDGSDDREMVDFRDDWVDDSRSTGGNNAIVKNSRGRRVRGDVVDSVVTFDPSLPTGEDQCVLNAFYFVNRMHQVMYDIGFTEDDGNFQRRNFGRGGRQSDRVEVVHFPFPIRGTATMRTPPDGRNPEMRLGLVRRTNRHTGLDSSVVYHEYTHGVTTRLVGGPGNSNALLEPQSQGMGEGWSDYVACSLNDTDVVGAWVVDDPRGIRRFRYGESFPDGFDDLGTGRYTADNEHAIGEIWCSTLMQMNRNIGTELGLQLVVDGLKLTPQNPSMLDARDAILQALSGMTAEREISADVYRGIWTAFAKHGMGPNASSNGPSVTDVVADYEFETEEERVEGPVVAIAAAADGDGYWLANPAGRVYAFGGAEAHGSLELDGDDNPVVDMASTPTGHGYWLTRSDGTVHSFGDATARDLPVPRSPSTGPRPEAVTGLKGDVSASAEVQETTDVVDDARESHI